MTRFNFFSELKQKLQVSDLSPFCQFVMIDFFSLYIEGVVDILSISETEIDIRAKKTKIRVSGENLEVVELEDRTLLIRGKIFGVNKI
ncbi:MAG: YabP/YqfC family sporulation protein [Christensenellales bacterium]